VLIAALFNVANPVAANVVMKSSGYQSFEAVILIALIAAVVIVPVNVGESDKTTDAVPVSSAKAEAKSADVNEPCCCIASTHYLPNQHLWH
jgi:hypothetical protein